MHPRKGLLLGRASETLECVRIHSPLWGGCRHGSETHPLFALTQVDRSQCVAGGSSFSNLQIINGNELFWGGRTDLSVTGVSTLGPVKLTSRSGFPDPWSDDFGYTRSPFSQDYTRKVSMYRSPECDTGFSTQYRQVVGPAARGVEFAARANTDVPFRNCRFND